MDRVLTVWNGIASVCSRITSATTLPEHAELSRPKELTDYLQLNEYVYEICKPPDGRRPSVELVFLHGFQLDGSNEAYLTTWLSKDGSEVWLNWLAKCFPDVRILTISYDACAKRNKETGQGNADMFITCENMLQSLTDDKAGVGQAGCPVVLVGHSLGGLVMKQLCVSLNSAISLNPRLSERWQNLLDSIAGLFFYATPNGGSELMADVWRHAFNGALLEGITILNKNTARMNEEFRMLRRNFGWRTFMVGEDLPVTLGSFRGQIVTEASARRDMDSYYTAVAHNHFDVCRPMSATSAPFWLLSNFIGDVLEQWQRPGETIALDVPVVGIRGQVNVILQKLKGAQHLGLFGFGGIGKTTLAEVVYNTISKEFDYTCFLREVKRHMPMKGTRDELQNLILGRLHRRGRKVRNDFTWDRLKGKKVLIVLDDTESASQVLVMGERDGFGQDSRVIVTSRDSKLLPTEKFQFHSVQCLDYEDSKKLFCLNAFQEPDCPEALEDEVKRIVEKCEGLPMALRLIGKLLQKEEEIEAWDGVYQKLSRAVPVSGSKEDELWSFLRVSYDSLAEEEQEMFLDIATAFHDEKLISVQRAWKARRGNSAVPTWKNLLGKGLVSTTIPKKVYRDGMWIEEGDRRIRMHEMLRDLGRSIGKDTRAFYHDVGQLPALPVEGKSEVEVFKIVSNRGLGCPRIDLDIEELGPLEKLNSLWLDGVNLHGSCSSFPVNLKYLKLINCTWNDGFDSRSRRQPGFWRSVATGLGLSSKVASSKVASFKEVQHHRLRHLEIEGCRDLKGFLDTLGQLKALEYLTFDRCSLQAFPDTFKEHPALKHLSIVDCTNESAFSDGYRGFEAYQRPVTRRKADQDVDACSLPDSLGELHELVHLEITSAKLKGLPNSLGNLRKLNHLAIGGKRIETIPDALGELTELRSLHISGCDTLLYLPRSLGKLKKLRCLKISGCNAVQYLPDTLGELGALEKIEILSCQNLKGFPKNFGYLEALEDLTISNCKKLELPDSLGQLTKLRRLVISFMDLKAFPDSLGHLKSLERLVVLACDNLETLPQTLEQLQNLQHFIICGCGALKELPSTIDQLKGLRQFEIVDCQTLTALPDSLGQLESLESLSISECHKVETLPNTLGHLRRLQRLIISRCVSLTSLPGTIGSLRALEHLKVVGCHSLEGLPDTVTNLQALRSFRVDSCGGLKALPDALGKLKALDRLEITDCHKLKYLPVTMKDLKALRHFEIEWCHDLEPLRSMLASLQQPLDYLTVYSGKGSEAVVDTIGPLQASKDLKVCCGESKPYRVGELCYQQYFDVLPCSRPDERWWLD